MGSEPPVRPAGELGTCGVSKGDWDLGRGSGQAEGLCWC